MVCFIGVVSDFFIVVERPKGPFCTDSHAPKAQRVIVEAIAKGEDVIAVLGEVGSALVGTIWGMPVHATLDCDLCIDWPSHALAAVLHCT